MASHHRIGRDKQGRNAVCNEIEETRKILIDLCVGKGANTEQHSVRTGADASPQLTPFTAFISESMSGPPSDSLVRYAGFSKSLGPIESAHYLRKGQYFSLSSSANADAAILGQNFLFLLKEATHQRSITWNGNGTGLYSPTTTCERAYPFAATGQSGAWFAGAAGAGRGNGDPRQYREHGQDGLGSQGIVHGRMQGDHADSHHCRHAEHPRA